jgi:hypothetical protein
LKNTSQALPHSHFQSPGLQEDFSLFNMFLTYVFAMSNINKTLPKAVQDCHNLIVWLIPQLDKFPRNRRFTLGDRIETTLLKVLETLVEAAYLRDKRRLLRRANVHIAVVRHLWRAAYDLKVIPVKRFEHGARLTDELGKQIGGWLRSLSERG